jgi:hypothetical protein
MAAKEIDRLTPAIRWSRKQLRKYRQERASAIKDYVGTHYGVRKSDRDTVNMLRMAVTIYSRMLMPNRPQASVTPRSRDIYVHNQLTNSADSLARAVNRLAEDIRLEDTLKRAVVDAHFLMGIVRTGLEPTSRTPRPDMSDDPGQPFAECISFDDFAFDYRTRRKTACEFMGHRYMIPLRYLADSGYYDKKKVSKLLEHYSGDDSEEEGKNAEDRVDEMTIEEGRNDPDQSLSKKVALWDFFLPEDRRIVTVCSYDLSMVLREIDYEGPEEGPYHLLGYSDVPDHLIPLCPAAEMTDLSQLISVLINKMSRQAVKSKNVLLYSGEAAEQADRLDKASDFEAIRAENWGDTKMEKMPGVDQATMAFFMQMSNEFKMQNGNLDALGGLGPQSRTATQDQLLTESASKRVGEMQNKVIGMSRSVLRSLAWWLFYDPIIELPITKQVGELEIPWTFTPEDIAGDFLDYNFDVDVYSLGDNSPQVKLQVIDQTFMQVVQVMELLQQSGMTVDVEKYLELRARLSNTPELARLIKHLEPPQEPSTDQPVGQPPSKFSKKPSVTHRTYERINRPSATNQGKDKVMQSLLLGGKSQPDEMAAMNRTAY